MKLFFRHPYEFAIIGPTCFLMAWWLVYRFAPEAAGSGIPQVMAASEFDPKTHAKRIDAILSLKTVGIKVLSSLICVVGGGAVGREGPTIQIAASLFHLIGKKFQNIWPKRLNHQSLIVAGGAAGIASAFNTPLGGIVFAVEELATVHFGQFRVIVILAVIISGMVAQLFLGPYLYLGHPEVKAITLSFFPVVLLTGVVSGLAGAAFGRILFKLVRIRRAIKDVRHAALVAFGCGVILILMAFFFEKNSMGPGTEVINSLLFNPSFYSDWKLALARFVGSGVSYLSGSAGGIFAPSLAVGASIGGVIANLFHTIHPHMLVLVGMVGFLTGVTRAPLTSFVLVLEMTDRHSGIFPMMVAGLAAYAVSRFVKLKSFYELMKEVYMHEEGHVPEVQSKRS